MRSSRRTRPGWSICRKRSLPRQQIPTEEEALTLPELHLQRGASQYRTYYVLAIYTGCRRGELCALKWEDFLVDARDDTSVLTVSRSRSVVPGKGVVEGPTKNGHSRVDRHQHRKSPGYLQSYCCMKTAEAEEQGRRNFRLPLRERRRAALPPGHLHQASPE